MTAPVTRDEHSWTFWLSFLIGGLVIAITGKELVSEVGAQSTTAIVRWLVAADLVHDLVLAPIVGLAGWVTCRLAPRLLRVPLSAAMVTTGAVLIVALPALRGYGREQVPGNETVQPLDYTSATLTVLGAIWGVTAAWVIVRCARRARAMR